MDAGRAVINPLIYAEVSVGYQTIEELEELLPPGDYECEPLSYLAGFAAGKARPRRYRRLPATDPRRPPLPYLLPDHQDHRPPDIPGRRCQVTSTESRHRTVRCPNSSYAPTIG